VVVPLWARCDAVTMVSELGERLVNNKGNQPWVWLIPFVIARQVAGNSLMFRVTLVYADCDETTGVGETNPNHRLNTSCTATGRPERLRLTVVSPGSTGGLVRGTVTTA